MRVGLLVGAIALLFLGEAIAQTMYRCAGADGKVAYQDRPCATGAQQEQKRLNSAPAPGGPAVSPAGRAKIERDEAKVAEIERRERQEEQKRQAEQDRAALRQRLDKINQDYKARNCASIEHWMQRHADDMRAGGSIRSMERSRRELEYERAKFDRECR